MSTPEFTLEGLQSFARSADLYTLYAVAGLGVILACLLVRLLFGASPAYLARTRFYELPPVRLLFHTFHAAVWLASLAAAFLTVRHGWAYSETSAEPHLWTALVAGGTAVTLLVVGVAVYRLLILIPKNRPPTVDVRHVTTEPGIDPQRMANLGREQFPQMLAFGHTAGCWVRGVLMVVGFAGAAVAVAAATDWGKEVGLYAAGTEGVRAVRGVVPAVPAAWAVFTGVSAALGLGLLLLSNGTYTLLRFPRTLVVGAVLAAVSWSSAAAGGATDDHLGVLAGGLGLAFVARWGHDLSRAARFKRAQQVTRPIARRLAEEVPDLDAMRNRKDCQLDPLDEKELRDRITTGCRNVEEAGPLVTRNLARFLALVRIEYEHVTAAELRYLTVRRYVSTAHGGGTTRGLQHPVVPMWNERLFPLHPPSGFRDWIDPLHLGWDWDIVQWCSPCGGTGRVSCGGCGGSGQVQRSETYTEYSGGQSVSRTRYWTETCGGCGGSGRVTCGNCSGCGKVVVHQTLNTQWQRLMPTCTAPHVRLPEFMDDAEERVYYRVPLVEDREQLVMLPKAGRIGQDLVDKLDKVVPALSADLPEFARTVEDLHDGYLYRADFQVTGFWVLRIAFRRLPGKVGWFFGRRPEFYFPALPLSWGTVGTVLFVLPFLILTVLLLAAMVAAWVQQTLPPIG